MLTINILRNETAIHYAAQELKKYLRMMMPEGGEISITGDPEAKDGFRLGLLTDFGKYELELERYYDHGLCAYHITVGLCSVARRKPDAIFE